MSFAGLLVHDITIVTPGVRTDRLGDSVNDWALATRATSPGRMTQRSQSEVLANREAQLSDWVLYLPADAAITGHERIEWNGETFEVAGPPKPAYARADVAHHLEVSLNRVEG